MSISARIVYVPSNDLIDEPAPTERGEPRTLPRRRQLAGLALAAVVLPLLTLALDAAGDDLSLEGQVLLYLVAVVGITLVGGVVAALPAAIAAALLINFFFVEPVHTLDIRRGDQALSLAVFVLVAALVSVAVELAERRARAARQAAEQAETLAALAGADLDDGATLHGILEQARRTFGLHSVVLLVRDRDGDWSPADHAGPLPGDDPEPLRFDIPVNPRLRLVGRGPALFAEDQRVLQAFAAAAETALAGRRLSEAAQHGRELAVVDRQRTALLAAVGHDLRTPLAAIKAAASGLQQTDVELGDADRRELAATIETSADRLDAVVSNLLDASRLQAGALVVRPEAVSLDQVVAAAVLAVPAAAGRVSVDVPETLPPVRADPGLLERVLANLLDNAVRHGGARGTVEVSAAAGAESAKLAIVDHGPGVTAAQRAALFLPFGDDGSRTAGGVGLGLWVARGFTEAMGGALVADESDGGGLTMRVRLPLADRAVVPAGGGTAR